MLFTDNKTMQISNKEQYKREKLPDILKGFAIILVVLGHCIQEGSGELFSVRSLYFYDKLYQFIYSFHMPLFMAVSGYLCWGSMKRAVTGTEKKELLKRRAFRLLMPIFLWTGADTIRSLIAGSGEQIFHPVTLLLSYFHDAFYNLWFLWAVFWCFLVVYLMHYFFHDSVILYVCGYLVMFFLPDGVGLGAYKFMLPFFMSAFYIHGYMETHDCSFFREPGLWKVLAAGLAFGILFVFFDENSLIYLSGYKLVGKNVLLQLTIDLYRTLIGFAGILFFVLLWQYLLEKGKGKCNFRILITLGKNSLGIYILSGYILLLIVRQISYIDTPSYLLNLLETGIILPLSLLLTIVAGKIPFLCLFVGKKREKSATLS